MTPDILNSWDLKTAVRKAVDQNQLLEVLLSLGFSGPKLVFLISYLLSRNQRLRIKGKVSKPKSIHFEVPQGSVLGPLLFIFTSTKEQEL